MTYGKLMQSIALTIAASMIYMLAFPLALQAQVNDRLAYWFHGYNSGPVFWNGDNSANYHLSFPSVFDASYKVSSRTPYYKTEETKNINSVTQETYWNDLMDISKNINYKDESGAFSPLLIGHSMGGLIARNLVKQGYVSDAKGIITVGTPNRGAPILTNIDLQNIDKALRTLIDITVAIIRLPILAVVSPSSKEAPRFITDIRSAMLSGIEKSMMSAYRKPMGRDMMPGSAFLNALNSSYSRVPLITIYGNEHDPAVWRLATSGEEWPPFSKKFRIFNLADHTDNSYEVADNWLVGITTVASVLAAAAWALSWLAPWLITLAIILTSIAVLAGSALAMLRHFPQKWNSYLGAAHTERYFSHYQYNAAAAQRMQNCGARCFEDVYIPIYGTRTISDPSDGTIGTWHQQADGQTIGFEALGANHNEMNKHPAVRESLYKAFTHSSLKIPGR